MKNNLSERAAWIAVLVAGLGYFVDVFDMWLFGNFRVASLQSLGLVGQELTDIGIWLLNWQQAGFLVGGFIWGIMGDKRGRAEVMFGSIFIYSLATFLNAFVTNVDQYAILRFFSGLGLAGEIGAGITLISELLPKHKRGIGTTFVTALGVSGAIAAAAAGKYMDWKTAYFVGGLMGFALLLLRILVHESGLYSKIKNRSDVAKGSLALIFKSPERILKYCICIMLGIPIYLCFGLFVSFSPEIAKSIGITESFTVPDIMLFASIGLTVGDLLAGTLSQIMQSRKKPILIFLSVATIAGLAIPLGIPQTVLQYQIICGVMALATGYWACLITVAAEQFGTNIRATVATTIPNLIRGSSIIITYAFGKLHPSMGVSQSVLLITVIIFVLCFASIWQLKESFHRDLDYLEIG